MRPVNFNTRISRDMTESDEEEEEEELEEANKLPDHLDVKKVL